MKVDVHDFNSLNMKYYLKNKEQYKEFRKFLSCEWSNMNSIDISMNKEG